MAYAGSSSGAEGEEQQGPTSAVLPASLAHEINNPITAILNLLHLVRNEIDAEKRNSYISLIEQELGRIAQIARYGLHGREEGAGRQVTKLADLLESVLALYTTNLAAKHIEVSTQFDDATLPVHSNQLRRMLSNLLLNSIDALPDRGGRVNLRSCAAHEWSEEKRQGIRLTVADNGSGISQHRMPRIFEPFFTSKGRGGTGLGLALVRDIVTEHEGTLRVRSTTRLGRSGTVFSIFLPFRPPIE